MNVTPIIMQGPLVLATLEGRKTQTRRLRGLERVNVQPNRFSLMGDARARVVDRPGHKNHGKAFAVFRHDVGTVCTAICPWGGPGDLVYVRETFAIVPRTAYAQSQGVTQMRRPNDNHDAAIYKAGWERSPPSRWRPSIHQPRWASRITLRLTGVRVERLRDINDTDAKEEGVEPLRGGYWKSYKPSWTEVSVSARGSFCSLWVSINGAGSWHHNPWVWVLEYKAIVGNVDDVLREQV